MAKSGGLYLTILGLWALLIGGSATAFVRTVTVAGGAGPVAATLAVMSAVFISYFWLNGMKDVVYTLRYHLVDRRRTASVPVRHAPDSPHVVLVYCTYNDFEPTCLEASMRQEYDNYDTVILDDSTKPEFMAKIDAFAARAPSTGSTWSPSASRWPRGTASPSCAGRTARRSRPGT